MLKSHLLTSAALCLALGACATTPPQRECRPMPSPDPWLLEPVAKLKTLPPSKPLVKTTLPPASASENSKAGNDATENLNSPAVNNEKAADPAPPP